MQDSGNYSGNATNSSAVQRILAFAEQQANSGNSSWYRRCEAFVNQAFGGPGGAPTAYAAWQRARYKHAGDYNPPAGAALYWDGGSAGHAAISAGNGWVYSTDVEHPGKVSLVPLTQVIKWLGHGHHYLGWTEDVNGVRAGGLKANPSSTPPAGAGAAPPPAGAADGATASLDQNELMAEYGWTAQFLKQNPELNALFQKVVSGQITDAATFGAQLKNTTWWKSHNDQWKTNQALKNSDPAEYQRQLRAIQDQVNTAAGSLGGHFSPKMLQTIAQNAFDMGWSADQINHNLAGLLDWTKQVAGPNDTVGGQAAAIQSDIQQTAAAYGIALSDHYVGQRVAGILSGKETADGYKEYFKNVAKRTYGAYGKEIDAGLTMNDIAQPFKQSMAQTLEIDPNGIDLTDPIIKKALTHIDPGTGAPGQLPIWQFDQGLRQDPRWQYTDNATQTYSGLTASLGKTFGMM